MIFVYFILLVIAVLFYIMYVGVFSFYLMMFLIILPIVLFALSFYISRRLKVSFKEPVLKCSGQAIIHPEIIIENPTIFPVTNLEIILEYNSAVDKGKNITKINTPVLPMESHELRMNVASLHLGVIDYRIKKCRVYDILRLFKFKLRGKGYLKSLKQATIFVLPKYSHLENAVTDYSGYGIETDEYSPDKKGDDPSQIFDIHEYIEGDKPNRIHWKLSAKQDQVMVKDYSLMMSYAISIFVNLNTTSAEEYDSIIESAMSVSMLLVEKGVAHTVSWFDRRANSVQSINIKNEQDHIDCSDQLIRAKTYSDDTTGIFPFTQQENMKRCGHLIVVSGKLKDDEINSLTEPGYAARYTFAFTGSNEEQKNDTEDNISVVYIKKGRIQDAFADIVL